MNDYALSKYLCHTNEEEYSTVGVEYCQLREDNEDLDQNYTV